MNLEKLENLKREVGKWSQYNFGDNGMGDRHYLCSAFGIIEEFGELVQCVDEAEVEDCLADACIFAMDFSYRRNINLILLDVPSLNIAEEAIVPTMLALCGNLSHHLLKEIQGIRGYGDRGFAESQVNQTLAEILALVNYICVTDLNKTLDAVAQETWDNIVAKRDWMKNSVTG